MKIARVEVYKNISNQDCVFLTVNVKRNCMSNFYGLFFIGNELSRRNINSFYEKYIYNSRLEDVLWSLPIEGRKYEDCYFTLFGQRIAIPKTLYIRSELKDIADYILKVYQKELFSFVNESIKRFEKVFDYDFSCLDEIKIKTVYNYLGQYTLKEDFRKKCTFRRITFNTFLAMFDPHWIDCVVAHELCHHFYQNHGKDFYKLYTRVFPDWKVVKKMRNERKRMG